MEIGVRPQKAGRSLGFAPVIRLATRGPGPDHPRAQARAQVEAGLVYPEDGAPRGGGLCSSAGWRARPAAGRSGRAAAAACRCGCGETGRPVPTRPPPPGAWSSRSRPRSREAEARRAARQHLRDARLLQLPGPQAAILQVVGRSLHCFHRLGAALLSDWMIDLYCAILA